MSKDQNHTKEKNGDLEEPFIVSPSNNTNKTTEEKSGCCSCCKCTKKKCGIITAAIAVIIGLILAAGALRYYASLTGKASSEDSAFWNTELEEDEVSVGTLKLKKSIMDGEFLLASFDPNYNVYLADLGTPNFVIPMILKNREVIILRQPSSQGGLWVMDTKTDLNDRTASFKMGQDFEDIVGKSRKVTFKTNCQMKGKAENVLECEAISQDNNKLHIKSVATFSKLGFVDQRTLVNTNTTTKKYYQRQSKLEEVDNVVEEEDQDKELTKRIQEAAEEEARQAAENPFKTNSDDDFDDFK